MLHAVAWTRRSSCQHRGQGPAVNPGRLRHWPCAIAARCASNAWPMPRATESMPVYGVARSWRGPFATGARFLAANRSAWTHHHLGHWTQQAAKQRPYQVMAEGPDLRWRRCVEWDGHEAEPLRDPATGYLSRRARNTPPSSERERKPARSGGALLPGSGAAAPGDQPKSWNDLACWTTPLGSVDSW